MTQKHLHSSFKWQPIHLHTLSNGLVILIRENRAAPLFTSDVWVRVGSGDETPEINGSAHFLEHTLFKGTKKRKVGDIAREIESFGGRTNAATSLEYTHYYISGENRKVEQALEIHADVIRNSTLGPEEVDAERAVIVEEIKRSADNPYHIMWDETLGALFPNHPYGKPTLGNADNISKNISRDILYDFFKKWYTPANMFIIVTGDIDCDATFKRIEMLYGDWKAPAPSKTASNLPPKQPGIAVKHTMDIKRCYLQMAWRTVPISKPDEAICLDLLGVLLGQGRSSRLSAALKEKQGLVTSISSAQVSLNDDGFFLIRTEFEPIDESNVRDAIDKEITKLCNERVSLEELQKAIDVLQTIYMREAETNEGQAGILGNALIHDSLNRELNYLERLHSITPEHIARIACEYISNEPDCMVILSPKSHAARLEPKNKIQTDTTSALILENGLRVIHKKLEGIGLIGANITLPEGLRHERSDLGGSAYLTAQTLLKGTKKRDGNKLLWDLESLGADLEPYPEPDMLRMSLSVPAHNFANAFALTAETILMPAFSEEALELEKRKAIARLASTKDDMFENTWRLLQAKLFENHPYARYPLGTVESLKKAGTKDLNELHSKALNPEKMVISIVGDISLEDAIALSENLFGGLAPKCNTEEKTPSLPMQRNEIVRVEDYLERSQAMICIGWLGPKYNDSYYAAAKVLNTILGVGMSARLFQKIRNEASLAYAVQTVFPTRLDGAPFCAIIGTDPSSVEKVIEMTIREIGDLAEHGPTVSELDRAVSYVTGQFALDAATSLRLSYFYAWFEALGAGYDFVYSYPESVRHVTIEDVQSAAKKLAAQNPVIAITSPHSSSINK